MARMFGLAAPQKLEVEQVRLLDFFLSRLISWFRFLCFGFVRQFWVSSGVSLAFRVRLLDWKLWWGGMKILSRKIFLEVCPFIHICDWRVRSHFVLLTSFSWSDSSFDERQPDVHSKMEARLGDPPPHRGWLSTRVSDFSRVSSCVVHDVFASHTLWFSLFLSSKAPIHTFLHFTTADQQMMEKRQKRNRIQKDLIFFLARFSPVIRTEKKEDSHEPEAQKRNPENHWGQQWKKSENHPFSNQGRHW